MSEEKINTPQEEQEKKETPTPERHGNAVFGASPVIQQVEEMPFENVPLPSRGTIYPIDSPLYNKETLEIKVMTAEEEDILTTPAYLKSGKVVDVLLQSCLIDKRICVNDLIAGDRNALMVALRITGYGAEYEGEVTCGSCDEKYNYMFNLGELEIKRLDIDPVDVGMNLFEFVLPVSKKKVLFKFITGHDDAEMDKIHERRKKMGQQGDKRVTEKLRYAIIEMDGSQNKADIVKAISRMVARDSLALRRYMGKHECGMIMKQEVTCPLCGNIEEMGVPIGPGFFFPSWND